MTPLRCRRYPLSQPKRLEQAPSLPAGGRPSGNTVPPVPRPPGPLGPARAQWRRRDVVARAQADDQTLAWDTPRGEEAHVLVVVQLSMSQLQEEVEVLRRRKGWTRGAGVRSDERDVYRGTRVDGVCPLPLPRLLPRGGGDLGVPRRKATETVCAVIPGGPSRDGITSPRFSGNFPLGARVRNWTWPRYQSSPPARSRREGRGDGGRAT